MKGERVVNGEETTPSFHFGEECRLPDVRPEAGERAKAIFFPKHRQSTLFQMPYPHPTPMRLHLKHLISSMCRSHRILPLFSVVFWSFTIPWLQEVSQQSETAPQASSVGAAVCSRLSPFARRKACCWRHPHQRRQAVVRKDHSASTGKILLFQSDYKHRCWSSLRVQYRHAEYSCRAQFRLDCNLSLGCSNDSLNLNTLCLWQRPESI